jgi:hypothetical protein
MESIIEKSAKKREEKEGNKGKEGPASATAHTQDQLAQQHIHKRDNASYD